MLKFYDNLIAATPNEIAKELIAMYVKDRENYNKIQHIAAKLPIAKSIYDLVPETNSEAKIAAKTEYERIANEIKNLLSD